jgi:hypothetical protein
VKQLLAKGLDSKHELTNEHVIMADIASLFGNVKTFKTTNTLFPSNERDGDIVLEDQWQQPYHQQ